MIGRPEGGSSAGDAVAIIAQDSPNAAGLLVDLMRSNEQHTQWVQEQVQEGTQRELERWRQRALDAEEEQYQMQRRIEWLMYGGPFPTPRNDPNRQP